MSGSRAGNMDAAGVPWRLVWVLAGLVALTFLPALSNFFINYDDPLYVINNPYFDPDHFWQRIWQSNQAGNYHPLTLLSHALDCALFGQHPVGHHAVNVLWHVLNSCLLFVFLARLSQDRLKSFGLSLLWAIHPIQVQSVAWAAERKNLLSFFCLMVALLCWQRFKQSRNNAAYAACLVMFVLGLLCKVIVVVLPGILMVLELFYSADQSPSLPRRFFADFRRKIPFWVGALAFAWLTLQLQTSTGALVEGRSFLDRLTHPIEACGHYLWNTVWPMRLAVVYVLDPNVDWPFFGVSLLGLLAITAFVWGLRSKNVFPLMGWLIFLGGLFPVLGIVQAGIQGWADRYMYIPLAGLALMGLALPWPMRFRERKVLTLLWVPILGLVYFTQKEIRVWKNTETVFRVAYERTDRNWYAAESLAVEFLNRHQPLMALPYLDQALSWYPDHPSLNRTQMEADLMLGNLSHARQCLEVVQLREPDRAETLGLEARLLLAEGKAVAAMRAVDRAIAAQPNRPEFYQTKAKIFIEQHKLVEALSTAQAGYARTTDSNLANLIEQIRKKLATVP
ncbi:MAG: tetratricopeptide repeat protein [Acidobacteria bacterium]|nr:tetratricopeptide repeat protein [Acidobacteriota bacterium]MCB9399411.1 tetratricopeptide repeat protein [Acidobacteriota bacterium]